MKKNRLGSTLLYVVAALSGAILMFLIEPIIGKLLLPLFGGVPAVWNTCLVFFQISLLAGYAYAHWSIKLLGLKLHLWAHAVLILLSLLLLPINLPAWSSAVTGEMPAIRILEILVFTIGGPFFILSTASPLLQRWFASTNHPDSQNPYFLYAASNFGSFVALISYPVLVEPNLSLNSQSNIWAIGYILFVVLTIFCMVFMWRNMQNKIKKSHATIKPTAITKEHRARWLYWSFIPSSLLLGITAYITSDIAAVPLLWILPLSIYLLTFVLTFSVSNPVMLVSRFAPLAIAGLFGTVLFALFPSMLTQIFGIFFYLAIFSIVAVVAHGLLASNKPDTIYLTEYYLWIAVGGAAGGIFSSLIAPNIFNNIYELPLILLLSVPMLFKINTKYKPSRQEAIFALITLTVMLVCISAVIFKLYIPKNVYQNTSVLMLVLACAYILYSYEQVFFSSIVMFFLLVPIFVMASESSLLTERTFFGVSRVTQNHSYNILSHGTTLHGNQSIDAKKSLEPTTYYNKNGPLGDIMDLCRELSGCQNIAITGLGTGTIAAYGRLGDKITYYEIDALVNKIARNPKYFTYIRDSKAKVNTVIGDGRLEIQHAESKYDLIILDAFSSDSIPAHLITREAFNIYMSKLNKRGIIAAQISNRILNLEPVLLATSKDQKLASSTGLDFVIDNLTHSSSQWVIFTRDGKDFIKLNKLPMWHESKGRNVRVWTDDYSNIFDAIK